jgi:hypothetical protein
MSYVSSHFHIVYSTKGRVSSIPEKFNQNCGPIRPELLPTTACAHWV